MKKIRLWMYLGLFFVITGINISLIQFVPKSYDPFPDTACTRQIYNSFSDNDNTDKIYEYASTINLNDNIKKCDELNNIKSIYYLNIDIKQGDTEVINVVKNYKHKVDKLTIRIFSQEAFDLSPLKELDKIYRLEVSENFREFGENEEVLAYLEDKGCIIY